MIFPKLHIGLLKAFKGDIPPPVSREPPPLFSEGQPNIMPFQLQAYRIIQCDDHVVAQVLGSWIGLVEDEVFWEDLSYISALVPNMNLGAKV